MKTRSYWLLLALYVAYGGFPAASFAQDSTNSKPSVFEYLTQQELVSLELELNLDSLIDNRRAHTYLPAKLTSPDGNSFRLEIRTRGKFRRKTCEIPPVKLKFSKKELRSFGLDTMNEIKLVIPCSVKQEYADLIIREYIAYRIFEHLSPYSIRARLIQLSLREPGRKKVRTMPALLVEHEEEVTARLRSTANMIFGIRPEALHREQTALTVLFEYLIGNTDWEITACRNILLLQPLKEDKCYPVPYDFDFSGLVAAPYASPNSTLGLNSVLDRYLMAQDIDPEALEQARQKILSARSAIRELCSHSALSKRSVEHMNRFMDAFFIAAEQAGPLPTTLKWPGN